MLISTLRLMESLEARIFKGVAHQQTYRLPCLHEVRTYIGTFSTVLYMTGAI